MPTYDSGRATNLGGINIQSRRGDDLLGIRFEDRVSAPSSVNDFVLYRKGTGLYFWDGSGETEVVSGGAGTSTPSWETLFSHDTVFTIGTGGFTIAGAAASATDVLTLTADAGTSGDVIQITNSGSGNDIQGTANTWKVTAAGVATFAGFSTSGTSAALVTTGAAVWTLKDNDAAALGVGAAGATTMLVFDTRNAAEQIVATVANGVSVVNTSNTVSGLLVTNNTITSFGNNADSAGLVVIRSTSATSGALLQLQSTEATMTTGYYLVLRSAGVGNKFTVAAGGVTTIAGVAGSNSLTLSAGDAVLSDGSLAIADADDAASFSVTNNTATTAPTIVFAGSGTRTGTTTNSFMTISPSGMTSGTGVYMPVALMDSGTALRITANALTTGRVLFLEHTTTTIADGGSMLRISSSTANTGGATNGTLFDIASTAQLAGVVAEINTALTTGGALLVTSSATMTTTGYLVTLTANSATTAAGILRVNGNALSDGMGVVVVSSSTALTSTGRLLSVVHSGSAGVSTVIAEIKSAAADETIILQVLGSAALALGKALNVSVAAMTTGTALSIDNADALTTGKALSITSNSADATARSLLYIKNDHASAVGAAPITILNDAVQGTGSKFKRGLSVCGISIWVSIDGTTPNGALTGDAVGDICLNAATGKPLICTGTNVWAAVA